MVLERPSTDQRPASPSPSRIKRPLSSPVSSSAKRQNSEDLMDTTNLSDTEGSLGASRLKISSTPASPSSDEEVGEGSDSKDDSPPTYDDATRQFIGPPGDTQLDIIRELQAGLLEEGDSWYLVSRIWYRRWITACTGTAETKEDDTSITVDQVGPIDNSNLVNGDGQLRKPLTDGVDLELLPAGAHSLLKEWYGSMGPDLERFVVNGSVEFYPPTFQIFLLCPTDGATSSPVPVPTFENAPTISLPSSSPFSALHRFASESFSLGRPTRLWRLPQAGDTVSASEGPAYVLSDKLRETGVEFLGIDESTSLDEALLSEPEIRIAVEQQKPDGSWLVDCDAVLAAIRAISQEPSTRATTPSLEQSTTVSTTTTEKKSSKGLFGNGWSSGLHKPKSNGNLTGSTAVTNLNAKASGSGSGNGLISSITGALTRSKTGQAKAGQRGLVGLSNLGNTCFMNSAIQCMSNTKELKDYFLSGAYKNELNPDNPLGMRGQVAEAFGQLIERMWHGTGSSVAPREFKQAVARFAPQFSGYGQQDSSELLAFLLDGTHEDLNRILKKPGTSAPDWEGGGDKELVEMAKTCWEQYRSRNDSVIVDLFQGQYRSTVVCPDCDKVSITFDPFMYVTTNLPVTKKWNGTVYVVPKDQTKKVVKLDVEVPKNGTLKTLKNCVGKILSMDPKSLVVTEEWHSKFFKEWPDDDSITEINTKNDKILIYETSGSISQPRFRKNKGTETPQDPNAPIILVVLHRKADPKTTTRMTFGSSSGGSDFFASPFVLSLSREEASSVEGIKRALIQQYARVTTHGQDLVDYLETELKEEQAPPSATTTTTTESDSTTSAPNVDGVVAPPTPAADSPMETDENTPLDSSSTSTPLTDSTSSLLPPPIPSTTAASTPPPPTPESSRRTMFTLSVSKNRRNPTSLPLDQGAFIAEMEPLENRLNSAIATGSATTRPAVNEDYDMFSSSSSTSTPKEEVKETVSTETQQPQQQQEATPLIRTGDYIIVDWDPSACEYFFSSDSSKWEETEEVVDPSLAERRALAGGGKQKQTITLSQCLSEFTKEERLGEEDMWYCSSCKDFKQATKKVEIWKSPDVLVFALKRFSSGRYTRDKIDDFVEFPLEGFDMEPFVEGDKVEKRLREEVGAENVPTTTTVEGEGEGEDSLVYDLYAVSNHFGGLGGGHYTAFAKNPDNNKWYDFDDSRVSPLSDPSRVVSSAAYLLFYRRRTARPIGGAKSIQVVESAIQSQQASAVPSLQPSPFASTENLPTLGLQQHEHDSTTIMPGSFDQSDLEDEPPRHHHLSSAFAPSSRGFTGIFAPRTLTNRSYTPDNDNDNDNEDDLFGDRRSIDSNEASAGDRDDETPFPGWDASPIRTGYGTPIEEDIDTELPKAKKEEVKEIKLDRLKEGQQLDDIE
ncbi:putative ubiquitin-specific protease UBP12 [Sporobolomyces salmoneus]|uniref:putative ubiquitin-specific protease UBP12 n=1 Tax=Sporobolomyces salmoneus TaxID=183962 RepID=UPI0031738902